MEPESLPIKRCVSELAMQQIVSSWKQVSLLDMGDPSAWYNCSVAPGNHKLLFVIHKCVQAEPATSCAAPALSMHILTRSSRCRELPYKE